MTGSPLVDLGSDVSVDPDRIAAPKARKATPPTTLVYVSGVEHAFLVEGTRDEIAAKLWRPEYATPPGVGRIIAGPPKIDAEHAPHVKRSDPGVSDGIVYCVQCSVAGRRVIAWNLAEQYEHNPPPAPPDPAVRRAMPYEH